MAQSKNTNNKKKTTVKKTTPQKPRAAKRAAPAAQTPPVKQRNPFVGFCITGVIALLLIFLLVFKDMAFFGKVMRPFLCGLVGEWGIIIAPLYLIKLLFTWFKDRKNDKVGLKWFFSTVNYLSLLMIIHRLSVSSADRVFGAKGWTLGREGIGSGFIGGNAFCAFSAFMGEAATVTVAIILLLLTLPLLFDSTPLRVLRGIINGFRTLTVQVADEDDGYEKELTANVDEDNRRRVKTPAPAPVKRDKPAKKRPVFEFPDDEVDEAEEIKTLPEQAEEINRTRKKAFTEEKTVEEPVVTELPPVDEPVSEEPIPVEEPVHETFDEPVAEEPVTEEPIPEEPVNEEPIDIRVEPVKEPEAAYVFPPVTLLTPKDPDKEGFSPAEVLNTSELLVQTLANFGVRARVVNTCCGPTVTRYEVQPDAGVRVKQIANLSDDIALHLAATSIRMEAPIPGKSAVGIEIPNRNKNIVRLRELIEGDEFKKSKEKLLCCLGVDVVGNPVTLNVAKMPHLLIAGATGMGKSVCINSLIVSLLYRAHPDEVKLILIDPKKVEFSDYNGIPHLLVPVVTEPKKAAGSLSWAVLEMERRFSEIQEVGAKNLEEYNELTADDPEKEYIPQVVIIIDELADLMMTAPGEVENSICRLAQKARAAGMYLIIGTQRPSVDVITGLIKANIPSRIACKVASQVDSRTILDIAGAEKLMGRGDMLYNPVGTLKPKRVQGAFVEGREVISVCTYLKQAAEAKYSEDVMAMIEKEAQLCGEKPSKRAAAEAEASGGAVDSLEMQVIELAIECDTISTSLIQRRLSIGYSRAARIIDKLEQKGIVGPFDAAAKKRKVLITKEEFMKMQMNQADENSADAGGENKE